jgi:steroid 5-alpha reductase family enzyme
VSKKNWLSIGAIVPVVAIAALLALAGSDARSTVLGLPVFAAACLLVFAVQWLFAIPSILLRTERVFDLAGGSTYIAAVAMTAALSRLDARSILLLALVTVWAGRLATFLFLRVLQTGKDARFDEIKQSASRQLLSWTLQGLWITGTSGAALAAIASTVARPLGPLAWAGLAIWCSGLTIEGVADEQKRRFRKNPENRGRFIRSGLWAWSRHPNYFGEIVLWIGVALIAAPALRGWQFATLLSPAFVAALLIFVSGIPLLEKRADEKWGGQEDYEAYKRRTSVLIPRPPRTSGAKRL